MESGISAKRIDFFAPGGGITGAKKVWSIAKDDDSFLATIDRHFANHIARFGRGVLLRAIAGFRWTHWKRIERLR